VNRSPHAPRRFVVIGGGISGLAAAWRLVELDHSNEVILLEASERLGGVVQTERHDDFLVELGADSFITSLPWGLDLCQQLGFADELITTNSVNRQALVVRSGRLEHVPDGFLLMAPTRLGAVLSSTILSWRGKLRLASEVFMPRGAPHDDESVASFARRRLGREAFERLVQPLVAGIYTADPERLSLRATFPRFLELERHHRSLILGARRERTTDPPGDSESGARYSLFVAPRSGMSSMVEAIAAALPPGTVRLQSSIEQITRLPADRWRIRVGTANEAVLDADGLILTAPAHHVARLLAPVEPALADDLAQITYAGSIVVVVGYRRDQIAHPLEGFGFVVPEVERRRILACSFSSVKFSGRAPERHVLLRVFLGGACHPQYLQWNDPDLRRVVVEELGELLGARGKPAFWRIARWERAMPQYHVGHVQLVERIESRLATLPNLQLAGNALRGVGIPHCIHSGWEAAERLLRCDAT